MRWILIDKFNLIEPGKKAQGVRNVTRSEGALVDVYPCFPVMPSSLQLEMMAQVGGVLSGATINFEKEVVLAKISNANFHRIVRPPSSLVINATLKEIGENAAMTDCVISEGSERVAEASIFFGLFDGLGNNEEKSVVFSKGFVNSFALKQIMNTSEAMN